MRNESSGTGGNVLTNARRLVLLIARLNDLSTAGSCRACLFRYTNRPKQRYAFAYTVASSFILIKQRLWREQAQRQITAVAHADKRS